MKRLLEDVFGLACDHLALMHEPSSGEIATFRKELEALFEGHNKQMLPTFYVTNIDTHDNAVFHSMLKKMQRGIRPGGVVRLNDEEFALFKEMVVCPLHIR